MRHEKLLSIEMHLSRGHLVTALAAFILAASSWTAAGQSGTTAAQKIAQSFDQTPTPILLNEVSPPAVNRPADGEAGGKFRTRQALILSGVAVSMLAYGYFVLRFNNSRTDSEQARLAYESDVRQNAQRYVDEGVSLDEIPSYFAWERAFTDAANDRELVAVAGLSAFLLSMAAILDSATAGRSQSNGQRQTRNVSPVVDFSLASGDVRLGARIGL